MKILDAILGWFGVNKFLVIASIAGVLLSGGIYLWKDNQVARAEKALADQQRDIAIEAAKLNADTIARQEAISKASQENLAKYVSEVQTLRSSLNLRLMEISNAPVVGECPRDPVLDGIIDRVWGAKGGGPRNQAPAGNSQQVPSR